MAVGVFDLGGVLYDFAGRQVLEEYTTLPDLNDQVLAGWASLPFVNAFETGKGTVEEFADGVIDHFKLAVTPEQFVKHFRLAARGFYPGALRLVRASRFNVTVTLSNTNELHWPRVLGHLEQVDPFDFHFPSHLIGHHKPEPGAYEFVLSRFAGEEVLFFDDRFDNVEAAQRAGMRAYKVQGVDELKSILIDAGMMSSGPDSAKLA